MQGFKICEGNTIKFKLDAESACLSYSLHKNLCRERVNPTSNNEISSKAVKIHTDRCQDVMCIYCHNWLKGVLWLGKYPHINWVHFYFKQSTIIWYVIPHDEFWA